MRKILIVANETLVSAELTQRIHEMSKDDPLEVLIVVPARPTDDDPSGIEQATRNLGAGIEAFRRIGLEVSGRVAAPDPMAAAASMIEEHPAIERIVVSTLPIGTSRWLRMDLPHRVKRRFKRSVEHVVGTPAHERKAPADGPLPVLLVEDDEADVELARLAFDGVGTEVDLRVAHDGAEALSYLQLASPPPALVLLDLKMPVMDGHTMLERLGSELGKDTLNDLNIVVLSSSASESDRERAHLLGAQAYVVKDPDFDQFQATITSLVNEAAHG